MTQSVGAAPRGRPKDVGAAPRGRPSLDDRLRALHDAGLKSRQIAARLGVDPTTVSRHLRPLGCHAPK
jgi:hypothetical protein